MLSQLPVEILAQILSSNWSYLVIELWKCGDKTLNHRLAHRGCLEVDLQDDTHHTTSRWPKMLTSLRHLRKLRIHRASSFLMPAEQLSIEVRKLAPTLEVLKLTCQDADLCLFNFDTTSTGHLASKYERGSSRLWDVTAYFPSLHTLRLSTHIIESAYAPFSGGDLAALPSTLVDLSLSHVSLRGDKDSVQVESLPPNLENFRIQSWNALDASMSSDSVRSVLTGLPPNLTRLSGLKLHRNEDLSALPRKLRRTVLLPGSWCAQAACDIPPDVEHLEIMEIMKEAGEPRRTWSSWINELPKNLTALSVGFICSLEISAEGVKALPRTLKSLEFRSSIHWPSIEAALDESSDSSALWPPLRDLVLATPGSILFEERSFPLLKYLPNTLNSAILSTAFSDLDLDFSQLPTSLSNLEMYISRTGILQTTNEEQAPSNLRRLFIGFGSCNFSNLRLPPSLQELHLRFWRLSPSEISTSTPRWPSNLDTLSLSIANIAWLKDLPTSLCSLEMTHIVGGGDFANRCTSSRPEDDNFVLRSLARLTHLKSLILASDSGFQSSINSSIPKTLTQLQVSYPELTLAHFENLPRSLRQLSLTSHSASFPSSKNIFERHWPPFCEVPVALHSMGDAEQFRQKLQECHRQYPDPRVILGNR